MLLFLAFLFSILSFGPLVAKVARCNPKKSFSLRAACVGTVDELFSAVFVFALSVMVSTFVFRYRSETRFDALLANALSLFCSACVIMLAAPYWAHNQERPHATISVLLVAVLTIVMFGTHAHAVNMHASAAELACGTGRGHVSVVRGDPFNLKGFNFVPVSFCAWCLALVGALFHHPFVRAYRPKPGKWKGHALRIWMTCESLACVSGFVCLIVLAAYFFHTWKMMKITYGGAFQRTVKVWGFGQYLAIFTWLPPVLCFLHLLFAGLEGTLKRKMPRGWDASRKKGGKDSPNDVELQSRSDNNESTHLMGNSGQHAFNPEAQAGVQEYSGPYTPQFPPQPYQGHYNAPSHYPNPAAQPGYPWQR